MAATYLHLLYFISGATALIYEVVWTRLLTLELGHTVASASTVLAAFMGGLAVGASIVGRFTSTLSPRTALRAYAAAEAAIGIFALLVPSLVRLAHPLLSIAYADGSGGAVFQLARLAAAIIVVSLPAAAMGATYPLIVRAARIESRTAASLYATNTAGAALGALAAGFLLLPALGMFRASAVAVVGNLAVAGFAWRLVVPGGVEARHGTDRARGAARQPAAPVIALAAVALSGFAALLLEIAWTRTLAMVMGPTTYAFSSMVACFIVGLALGSAAATWLTRRTTRAAAWLSIVLALAALATAAALPAVDAALLDIARHASRPDARLASLLFIEIGWAVLLVSPAAVCFGAVFPLALSIAGASGSREAAGLYAANTTGAIGGSLAAGLAVIPRFGLQTTFALAVAIVLAVALLFALREARRTVLLAALAAGLAVFASILLLRSEWNRKLLSSGAYKYAAYIGGRDLRDLLEAGTLRDYREGATGTVAVRDLTGVRTLSIDGKVDASTGGDMLTQRLLAHLPLLEHGAARRVAVVGLGSGVTLGSALTHDVESADVVEISPEVVQASRWFARENRRALDDPRVRLLVGDARTHFRLARGVRYDVVISEPSNPWMAGVAALFTREFFESVRDRLAPGGVVCQWTHTYDMSRDNLRSIVATFASVFPHVTMWLVGDGDLLLLGRTSSARNARLQASTVPAAVRADLAASGIRFVALLQAFRLGDETFARNWAGEAPLQVDDRMALEFSAPEATVGASREDNAADLLRAAKHSYPQQAEELRDLGNVLLRAQATRRATEYLVRAAALLPRDRATLAALVRAAASAGDVRVAERTLDEIIARDPGSIAARLEYARVLAARGSTEEAIRHIREAERLSPGSADVHEELAAIAADMQDRDALASSVDALRASRPAGPRTAYFQAVLHLLSGQPQEARVMAARAAEAEPDRAASWNLLGAALGALEAPDHEIRRAFERALAADPADPTAYVNLATLALQNGNAAEAADWFAQALTIAPDNRAARDGLAAARQALH
ncbi:MAG TPA: fused MFS/spermidine synthase [Vicinamibacterales bacterium]|nr:fused MFS/spermidine synthase [Vicinamibacterales bacterium]